MFGGVTDEGYRTVRTLARITENLDPGHTGPSESDRAFV
jgi:hypothetical protein